MAMEISLYGEKAIHRNEIARAKRAFLRNGGMVGVYDTGAAWDAPMSARQMVNGKNRETPADALAYLNTVRQRVEAKRAAARRAYDANV